MIGETFGSYVVKEKIGEGGMGAVYLAEHPLIGRKVAIKLLRPEYSDNADAVSRFFREARATASLRHPALIDVFDYGVHPSGSAYIVMELLEGESLESRMHKGPLPIHTAVDFVRQIAVAMSVAHAAGIIHRDLKPGNVYIEADRTRRGAETLKILDFGIAKLTHANVGTSQATQTNMVMGTPLYMSPEQCRGAGRVDARSDIYSLGCMFYEMLCGRVPFGYSWAGELVAAHLHRIARFAAQLDPAIPPPLEAIVQKALAKDPAARQQTMDELVSELDAYVAQNPSWPVAAMRSGTPPPPAAVVAHHTPPSDAGTASPQTEKVTGSDHGPTSTVALQVGASPGPLVAQTGGNPRRSSLSIRAPSVAEPVRAS